MLFSMLANLAEDRHSRDSQSWPTLSTALAALEDKGVSRAQAAELLDHGLIRPVLTAHPTEVRRKSMIDHRSRIEALMTLRANGAAETPDGDDLEEALVRQITLPWHKRALRHERLMEAAGGMGK